MTSPVATPRFGLTTFTMPDGQDARESAEHLSEQFPIIKHGKIFGKRQIQIDFQDPENELRLAQKIDQYLRRQDVSMTTNCEDVFNAFRTKATWIG